MDPMIGQITLFAGNFPPQGWQYCQGQLLSIAEYTAVYAVLGTQYGGDGVSTFALPDLRGRVPVHPGTAPGGQPVDIGETGGVENCTLLTTEMAAHTHTVNPQFAAAGGQADPTNNFPGNLGVAVYGTPSAGQMGAASVSVAGASQPHDNMQPWLCVNYIIALEGIFPARN